MIVLHAVFSVKPMSIARTSANGHARVHHASLRYMQTRVELSLVASCMPHA